MLFFNWRLGLCILGGALLLSPIAKWLDKQKAIGVWGSAFGGEVHRARWQKGNPSPVESAEVDASMLKDYGPIFKLYGADLDPEDATALMSIHRFIDEGLGEWSTVVETDGQEYPCFSILVRSFPYMVPACANDEDPALLIVTMDRNRKKVLDFSLNTGSVR